MANDGDIYATQSQTSGTQTYQTNTQDVTDPLTGKKITIKILPNGQPDPSDPDTSGYLQNSAQAAQDQADGTGYGGVSAGGNTAVGSETDPSGTGGAASSSGGGTSASDAFNQSLTNLQNYDPTKYKGTTQITTPVVSAPTIPNAPTVSAPPPVTPPSLDFNTGLTAPQITSVPTAGTIPVVSAPTISGIPSISAGGVSGGSVSAQNIDPANATATPVGDVSANGVGRDAEVQGLDYLKGVAQGTTKTAADWLLQKGVDENVGAAYGLAASLQGRNSGQALRQGLTSARTAIAKSSADVAAQKAQEQQTAMQQYATLGTSIAGQDLQAAMSNQSKDLQLSVSQMQAKIDILKSNQAAQLSAGEATLASQTSAQIATLQAQTSIATSKLQAQVAVDIANQTSQLDASKSNAANQVAQNIATLQAQVQVQMANLQAATQTQDTQAQLDAQKAIAQYNGQIQLLQQQQDQLFQAAKDTADNQTNTNIASAGDQTQTAIAQAQLQEKSQADMATIDAQLAQLGLSSLTAQVNAALQAEIAQGQLNQADKASWLKFFGDLGGDVAKVAPAIIPLL